MRALTRCVSFRGGRSASVRGRVTLNHVAGVGGRRPLTLLSSHKRVTDADVSHFRAVLEGAPGAVLTDADAVAPYQEDWQRKYRGNGTLVLRPRTTQQVAAILQHCNEECIPIVPQGGNTGLVGGSVPVDHEVVLSLSRMTSLLSVDADAGAVTCEAGMVLQDLESKLEPHGLTIPIDLGAKGSCQIGGNVATNAGGVHLLRYGSLHGSVLGLEVVCADGSVLDSLSTLRKDNTGYDLKQLFIGSEGTLGVITRVALAVPPLPRDRQVAWLACASFDAVKATLRRAREMLGESLSAFEFMDRDIVELCEEHLPHGFDPLPHQAYPLYVLVEVAGSHEEHNQQKMSQFLEHVMEEQHVVDGTMAQDITQAKALWKLREEAAEALRCSGPVYKYDVSLPLEHFYELVEVMRQRFEGVGRVVGYGHVGDGNLHLNVTSHAPSDQVYALLEPFVYEWIAERRGSISAEHGIGVMKTSALAYSKTPQMIHVMQQLKHMMDPKCILNPGKVLPLV